ncbi:WD40 repeat domain-containing protein [Phanerochaete sordida]|uniref:WD40 repeat domain-containing protein n=1 Tax=Phanerochaete sordida TaxID=48140 RepID=A0A9P3LI58_9APHY|nr:WD40 repeat domain-containing protein [Phanerochaete sordida]
MSQPPIILPVSTVQNDFESLITDVKDGIVPEETFWVSCYKTGEESVHGKVRLALSEQDRDLVEYGGHGGVTLTGNDTKREYTVACPSLGIPPTKVAVPARTYADPLPQVRPDVYRKISAFDVAPDGSQFATGYDDGSIYIASATSPTAPPSLARRVHLSSVTSVRFFPSSRVLLSAGADFALHILPAEPPAAPSASAPSSDPVRIAPVRTLKGHTRAVTATAIIARGRSVLSGAKDATLRLWDVSAGAQLRILGTAGWRPVLALAAGVRGEGAFVAPPDGDAAADTATAAEPVAPDPREVETADKVVFAALADGTFQAFDLGTKLSVFHSRGGGAALHSIAYSPDHNLVATGSSVGIVDVYDTRSLDRPLLTFQRNEACVEDLAFIPLSPSAGNTEVGLAIATEDGLPFVANVRPEGPSVLAELVGTDCDAVRSVKVGSTPGTVWTAGDDGVVRRYEGLKALS